ARVEKALRFIAEHQLDQPTLDEVAESMGLSPTHAQRIFTRWAGISPKKFLGFLTLEHAKALLADDASVLDAALDVGLSGPSRLHDLSLSIEGLTPGEAKSQGRDLTMAWGFHDTPFGEALFLASPRGLARLAFVVDGDRDRALDEARQRWPFSRFEERQDETATYVDRCFTQTAATAEPLPLLLQGSPFQIQVWRALLELQPGQVTSYGALARRIGKPGAARAVGTACARNRLGFIIPCHRVIREVGALGGYHWGLDRKRAILAWEQARNETSRQAASA
ncbi:MAG: methylated-DNA--[protein]-cysteine S-methyltransferase, partial [Pseudomonadota bacterium]